MKTNRHEIDRVGDLAFISFTHTHTERYKQCYQQGDRSDESAVPVDAQ